MKTKKTIFLILMFALMVDLRAQDYLITFTGSGASTTVTTVKVENLTQGTSLSISGSDVLHLKNIITGIEESISENQDRDISFFPNPMTESCQMQFNLLEAGNTIINLYDITGRKINEIQQFLPQGKQTFKIYGVSKGLNIVKVKSGKFSISGKIMCSNSTNSDTKIIYETTSSIQERTALLKGINTETLMQYTTGDRLKFTGTSGNYSTVLTDIPATNKTITFNFIACTDGDNISYPVVSIGTQIWMAENLKTTKYNNGFSIPIVVDLIEWSGLTTGAYCWYDNDINNKSIYGAMYNFYAVIDSRNICPSGWHVPTDGEWTNLTDYLGGESVAGTKLKEIGTSHWGPPNDYATNESGFTALPGGARYNNGGFGNIKYEGFWWSSTVGGLYGAWRRDIWWDRSNVMRNSFYKEFGSSIRCLKDN